MNIPFVDLKSQYLSIKEEIDEAIHNVIEKTAFVGGPFVNEFEARFGEFCNAEHCIGVGNGTDALYIALKCLGIGEGDETITAANSFIATSEAITRTGAKVIFCDIDPETYTINSGFIEDKITEKTKAVIPVHLYGQPADMDKINQVAKKNNLFVIEDAAQAHGAKYNGNIVGTLGDIACFSFYPGKNLGAYGDGGAVVTNDEELAKKCRMFANHGRIEKYNHEIEGINSRLDGIQASLLNVKINYLIDWNKKRNKNAKNYNERLSDIKEIVTPKIAPDYECVFHLYVIRTPKRNQLREFLKDNGIFTGIHYPVALPFLQAYRYLGYNRGDFPVSSSYQDEILSLPMFPELTLEQIEYVIQKIREFFIKI